MKTQQKYNSSDTVQAVPDGFHTVTPFLVSTDANGLLDFITKAFGGKTTSIMRADKNKVGHATIQIGDSTIMVSDATDMVKPATGMLYLYVEDCDAVYERALKEKGVTSLREPVDEFYGDRSSGVQDKWGNQWWIATHVEDVPEKELESRMRDLKKQSAN
jgi:PhnB protein